jgi:hypothetical protein
MKIHSLNLHWDFPICPSWVTAGGFLCDILNTPAEDKPVDNIFEARKIGNELGEQFAKAIEEAKNRSPEEKARLKEKPISLETHKRIRELEEFL